jgi:hypothetical protein
VGNAREPRNVFTHIVVPEAERLAQQRPAGLARHKLVKPLQPPLRMFPSLLKIAKVEQRRSAGVAKEEVIVLPRELDERPVPRVRALGDSVPWRPAIKAASGIFSGIGGRSAEDVVRSPVEDVRVFGILFFRRRAGEENGG